jgi:hypothetical protein
MDTKCPHCRKSLSGRLALQRPMEWRKFLFVPIPNAVVICSGCGGFLNGNPHPLAQWLNAAMWIALATALYGAFTGANIFFVAVAAILTVVIAVANWYVNAHVLRDWPAFRSHVRR